MFGKKRLAFQTGKADLLVDRAPSSLWKWLSDPLFMNSILIWVLICGSSLLQEDISGKPESLGHLLLRLFIALRTMTGPDWKGQRGRGLTFRKQGLGL